MRREQDQAFEHERAEEYMEERGGRAEEIYDLEEAERLKRREEWSEIDSINHP